MDKKKARERLDAMLHETITDIQAAMVKHPYPNYIVLKASVALEEKEHTTLFHLHVEAPDLIAMVIALGERCKINIEKTLPSSN